MLEPKIKILNCSDKDRAILVLTKILEAGQLFEPIKDTNKLTKRSAELMKELSTCLALAAYNRDSELYTRSRSFFNLFK